MSKMRHPFSLKEIYTFFLRRYNQGTLVAAAAAAAKSLQSCPDSVRPHRRQPSRLPCPWDSSGKELWSGLPFLLQCVKVKSESEDAQSCPTRSDTMDCSPPGSSVHGICQAGVLEWDAIAFSHLYTSPPLICGGYVLRPPSMDSETTDSTEPYIYCFSLYIPNYDKASFTNYSH